MASPEGAEPDGGQVDLGLLHSSYDISNVRSSSHRVLLGPLVGLAKRLLGRLLTPVLTQQTAYNSANIRMLDASSWKQTQLGNELHLLSEHHAKLRESFENVIRQQAGIQEQLGHLARQQAQSQGEVSSLVRQHAELQRDVEVMPSQQARIQEHLGALAERHAKLHDEFHAVSQVTEALTGQQAELQTEVYTVSQVTEALTRQQAELQTEVYETHAQALQTTHESVARAERKLRRILHVLTDDAAHSAAMVSAPKKAASRLVEGDFDYAGFEERFRGSEESIKARQSVYVQYFENRESVVEIGCGRGEFLKLLHEAGVPAKGVDLDLDMVLHCREKGLDVIHEDAIVYLESLPDHSLGGVFAAQVIEHLETSQITRLVKLCHQKLQPVGVLVLETLNPECLFVLYRWFWMDLTHTRLIHPETLKFLFESAGFVQVERRLLPPGDTPVAIPPLEIREPAVAELARFNAATDYLNKLLYGSAEYAVIGTK